MRLRSVLSFLLLVCGCHHPIAPPAVPGASASAAAAASVIPPAMSLSDAGIDEASLDRSVEPCDDFYRFACGGWEKTHEIPPDRSRWGSFSEIDERNQTLLRQTLEQIASGHGDPQDADGDKLGTFFSACMNEEQIERRAMSELGRELEHIARVKDPASLLAEVARQNLRFSDGPRPLFHISAEQDFKDASQVIATLDQSGLGLPDRDYYLDDDERSRNIRSAYEMHVAKMLTLLGEPAAQAARNAQTVMRIEHALAQASLARVERRDPHKLYHRQTRAALAAATPHLPWPAYFKALDVAERPEFGELNVVVPGFVAAVDQLVAHEPLDAWRSYLRWHLVHSAAPHLARAFVEENFNFYGQTLNGTKALPPRWKRCVTLTDELLGDALAQSFVRQRFSPQAKATAEAMVVSIEQAMEKNLDVLSWMDAATRVQALEKLGRIANKIGYPDKWRSYAALELQRDSHLGNVCSANVFEMQRQLARIGKPLDRSEWHVTAPTVNAYYDPSLNEMAFPAGILQAPFYSPKAHRAVNFGAIGMVMGHELTHGFDDEGRQFDAQGNLREWWSPPVGKEFVSRAQCVVRQFDSYVAVDALHVNGQLTLGENIADLGGLKLAYRAFMSARAAAPTSAPAVNGFTEEQLFFLGTAQSWCSKTRPENVRVRVRTDPHSPPEYRINGPLSNLSEFSAAFQCKPGQKMARSGSDRCEIW